MESMKQEASKRLKLSTIVYNDDFICPITHQYFFQPVIVDCGNNHSFEEDGIKGWMEKESQKDKIPICPKCREKFNSYSENVELKKNTEDFLSNNIEHLPFQYVLKNILKEFGNALNKEDKNQIHEMLTKFPHLIFQLLGKKEKVLVNSLLVKLEDGIFQECMCILDKKKKLLEFFLLWENQVGLNIIHYICFHGNTFKLNLCFERLGNNTAFLKKDSQYFHLASDSKNLEFTKRLFELPQQDMKSLALATNRGGLNLLMHACSFSNVEIVELILNIFQDVKDLNSLTQLLYNQACPNIFALATTNICKQGFLISLKLNEFLNSRLSPHEIKYLKQFMKNAMQVKCNTRIQTQINEAKDEILKTFKRDFEGRRIQQLVVVRPTHNTHEHIVETSQAEEENTGLGCLQQ